MSDSRIISLNNGRSPAKKSGDYITVGKAQEMVNEALAAERVENENMVKWYMQQLPGLVAKMLGDAMAAQGKELAPPPVAETPCRDCGNVGHHSMKCPQAGAMIPNGDYSPEAP